MITENTIRPPQGPARGPAAPQPSDLMSLLTRTYREAGLPTETARRCALADFRCSFPQFLTVGI